MFVPGSHTYQTVYRLLDNVTPLREDCGQLCGKLCCRPSGTNTGIYLLPGEENMFDQTDNWLTWAEQDAQEFDFPPSWQDPVYFVNCNGQCPREKRPFQCRSFPLTAHYLPEGQLVLIWETVTLPYRCPLLDANYPLEQGFINTVATAWALLLRSQLISDLVLWDSEERKRTASKTLDFTRKRTRHSPWRIVKVIDYR